MKKTFSRFLISLFFVTSLFEVDAKPLNIQDGVSITGELKKWHTVTLTFEGPEVSETDEYNPFLNYQGHSQSIDQPKARI